MLIKKAVIKIPILSNLPSSALPAAPITSGTGAIELEMAPLSTITISNPDGKCFCFSLAIQGEGGMIYGAYNIMGFQLDTYHIAKIQETPQSAYKVFDINLSPPNITISNGSSDTVLHVGILPILGGSNLTIPQYCEEIQ